MENISLHMEYITIAWVIMKVPTASLMVTLGNLIQHAG